MNKFATDFLWNEKLILLQIQNTKIFKQVRSSRCVMANELGYNLVVSHFELQSWYYVQFWTNIFG